MSDVFYKEGMWLKNRRTAVWNNELCDDGIHPAVYIDYNSCSFRLESRHKSHTPIVHFLRKRSPRPVQTHHLAHNSTSEIIISSISSRHVKECRRFIWKNWELESLLCIVDKPHYKVITDWVWTCTLCGWNEVVIRPMEDGLWTTAELNPCSTKGGWNTFVECRSFSLFCFYAQIADPRYNRKRRAYIVGELLL